MFRSRSLAVLLAFSLLVTAIPAAYAQVTYSVRRVDPTDPNAGVSDLNNLGEMVGATGSQPFKAVLWRNGQRIVLGSVLASGARSVAQSINDRSEITGYSSNLTDDLEQGISRTWIWKQGKMCGLGPLFEKPNVVGFSINNHSQIVGYVADQGLDVFQAFMWQAGRGATLLPVPLASQLNDRGEFLTRRGSSSGDDALYQGGVVVVPAGPQGALFTALYDLSNQGQIVGASVMSDHRHRALWWHSAQSEPQVLPNLPNAVGSIAWAINDHEQIVGQTTGLGVALLWQNGNVYRLHALIRLNDPLKPYLRLRNATRINNRGQIVAIGVDSRRPPFESSSYLLTPVQ